MKIIYLAEYFYRGFAIDEITDLWLEALFSWIFTPWLLHAQVLSSR